jgi:murein DD-endopeptidase MepM/ murein hydrolase activator NlpD
VTVLHDDGTFAVYTHLSAGIPVRVGERVARGASIGRSGNSGYCPWPHLHFAVARVDPDGAGFTTLPIRFGVPGGPGFVPKEGDFVGIPPKADLELAVFVGGKPTRPDEVVSVRRGERLAVRVEARPQSGPARDLTGHPALQLVAMTPWSVAVSGASELAIEPMPGFTIDDRLDPARRDAAVLGVFYLPAGGEIGLGQVQLRITDRKAGP